MSAALSLPPTHRLTTNPEPTLTVSAGEAGILTATPPDSDTAGPSYLTWLMRQIATLTALIDRIQAHQQALRVYHARRAEACWDLDRQAEVETLAAGLARRPGAVVARLRQTRHGAAWLIERWRALGRLLESQGAWTEPQMTLAFNLLGFPRELRGADPWGSVGLGSAEALVKRELGRFDADTLAQLEALDRLACSTAASGRPTHDPAELKAHARREAALVKRLEWARRELAELAELIETTERLATATATPPAEPSVPSEESAFEPLAERVDISEPLRDEQPKGAAPVRNRRQRRAALKRERSRR